MGLEWFRVGLEWVESGIRVERFRVKKCDFNSHSKKALGQLLFIMIQLGRCSNLDRRLFDSKPWHA